MLPVKPLLCINYSFSENPVGSVWKHITYYYFMQNFIRMGLAVCRPHVFKVWWNLSKICPKKSHFWAILHLWTLINFANYELKWPKRSCNVNNWHLVLSFIHHFSPFISPFFKKFWCWNTVDVIWNLLKLYKIRGKPRFSSWMSMIRSFSKELC